MNLGTLISKIINGRRERLTSPVPQSRRIDYRKLRVLENSQGHSRRIVIRSSGWHARAPSAARRDWLGRSRRTGFMEDLPGLPDQSALTPANFTTLPHFSVSSTMSLPKSLGEPVS